MASCRGLHKRTDLLWGNNSHGVWWEDVHYPDGTPAGTLYEPVRSACGTAMQTTLLHSCRCRTDFSGELVSEFNRDAMPWGRAGCASGFCNPLLSCSDPECPGPNCALRLGVAADVCGLGDAATLGATLVRPAEYPASTCMPCGPRGTLLPHSWAVYAAHTKALHQLPSGFYFPHDIMPATYFADGVCAKDGWVFDANYHISRTDLLPRYITLRNPGDASVDGTVYAAHRVSRKTDWIPHGERQEGFHEVQSVRNCYEICKHMQLIGMGCDYFSVSTVEAPYYCFVHKSCELNRGFDVSPADGLPDGLSVSDGSLTGEGDPFNPSRQNAGPSGQGDGFFSRMLQSVDGVWNSGLLPAGGKKFLTGLAPPLESIGKMALSHYGPQRGDATDGHRSDSARRCTSVTGGGSNDGCRTVFDHSFPTWTGTGYHNEPA